MPNSINEANINLALQGLQKYPGLSMRRAVETYNINRFTLRNRQLGKQSRRDTMANSRKLSNLEEEKLTEYILDLDARGVPSRISGVEDMANPLRAARDASPSASAGRGILSSANHSFKHVSFKDMTISRPNVKIQSQ
jgi:hypothetical protein